ncbi:hypothetical protein [Acaricomes phytoseiuli]|uniref:hypothetical protein n=1 Tax=Acaricomes phytoseiuli TaxID=291968 RepID=UPI0003672183|nr:hypothetical protein [Acaricomes phytoseiuli]
MSTELAEDLDVTALAAEYVAAEEMAEHWILKAKAIKEKLLTLDLGTYEAGPYKVMVKAGARRFNAKAAEAAYPIDKNPAFYKPAFDRASFEKLIAPAVVEQYRTTGQPSVVIK